MQESEIAIGDRAVFDPELPEAVRKLFTVVPASALRPTDGTGAEETNRGTGCLSGCTAVLFILGVLLIGSATRFAAVCLVIGTVIVGCRVMARRHHRVMDPVGTARKHRHQCVRPSDLEADPGALLVRAVIAVDTVFSSAAHRDGVVDRARNEVELPHGLWKIAKDLRSLSELTVRHREAKSASVGGAVDSVLETQAAALHASRDAIEKRVEALEQYARSVGSLDRLAEQHAQIQALQGVNDDYLNLLASVSEASSATAHPDPAAHEAELLSRSLKEAIEHARIAAELALPAESDA
ncbi:hypothetical protein [Streptomyces sp. PR69]|uniref:hypothetical protein n=1 Tax=Streptomyces sp. PR69 TaxID=2984950 RepID=UPI0022645060|nr:hypothetical protein [Streptomyces sp. PR69]